MDSLSFQSPEGGLAGGAALSNKKNLAHGRMILEAVLCVSNKIAGVGTDASPPPFASRMPAS